MNKFQPTKFIIHFHLILNLVFLTWLIHITKKRLKTFSLIFTATIHLLLKISSRFYMLNFRNFFVGDTKTNEESAYVDRQPIEILIYQSIKDKEKKLKYKVTILIQIYTFSLRYSSVRGSAVYNQALISTLILVYILCM